MYIDTFKVDTSQTKYCHYTTIENARNIINGCSLYLNKLKNMNDRDEFNLHVDENDKIFVFSMCHSEAKDIPLFYLYSGIDGKGCRLEFTKSKIIEMLKGKVFPVNKSYRKLKNPFDQNDYEIMIGWIHYLAFDGTEIYRNKVINHNSYSDAMGALSNLDESLFVKRMYWRYEKEFRIVIKFRIPITYDRVALEIPINNHEKGIIMKCGPELDDKEFETIKSEFSEYGINKVDRFNEINISMGLVDRNRDIIKKS